MDGNFNFFMPFAKVEKGDDGSRIVTGYASTPTKDLDGEIVTLDAVKSALPSYMEWRNIRQMHQPIAVGVTKEANVDKKGLYITGKIVDENAIKLLDNEVLKGFSLGGRKLAKKGDNVTSIELIEISLVDRPANPDCRIDAIKMAKGGHFDIGEVGEDSESEVSWLRKMVSKLMNGTATSHGTDKSGTVEITTIEYDDADYLALIKRSFTTAQRKESEEKGHAMPGGGYPIENEHDLRNAIQAFGRAKNPEATKKHIIQRAKALGATSELPASWGEKTEKAAALEVLPATREGVSWEGLGRLVKAAPDMLQIPEVIGDRLAKGMGTVADLAYAFSSIRQCQRRLLAEGAIEKDGEDAGLAARLGHVAAELASVISQKAEHEASESLYLTDVDDIQSYTLPHTEVAIMSLTADAGDLAKRASKVARSHMAKVAHHLQKAATAHMEGVKCMGKAAKAIAGMKKAADGFSHEAVMGHLEKAHGHFAEAADHMDLANHHLSKSAEVTEGGPGANTEGMSRTSQETMTEGQVPWYEADEPYHKGARTAQIAGGYTEEQVQALLKGAKAEARAEELEKRVNDLTGVLSRVPAGPRKGSLFAAVEKGAVVEKGANGGASSPAAILLDGVDLNDQSPAARRAGAAHMVENMIQNRAVFAKSLFDPEFKGAAGLKKAN